MGKALRAKFIIGIDIGGTNLKIGLLDLRCKILRKEVLSTKGFLEKEDLILALERGTRGIIRAAGLKKQDILVLGVGLPGPVDAAGGLVHFLPNVPGWRNVKLKKILEKRLGLPVYLDNDVKMMTLAEKKLGAAAGFGNVLCITLGTGVGGGLILDEKLYRGRDNAAGEIGHLPINEKGPRCNCGGIACLEAYIGNNNIARLSAKAFGYPVSPQELSALARKGNKTAQGIWSQVGRWLGLALAGAANLLNLDAVVIGGGVSGAGKILFDAVRQTIKERAMSVQSGRLKVLRAKLGPDAGIIGAAIMAQGGL